jgi:nucleotide-binding universal stress UspA family protein
MFSINVIVVPTDFSERSLVALDYAVDLAEAYDAELKVVFVNEPGLKISDMAWVGVEERSMDDKHLAEARRSIEKTVLDRIPVDLSADARVLYGEAVDKIIEYASDVNADLIVMATHGRTGVSHVLLGSVAGQVVRKAPCPVLTVKNPAAR